MNHEPPSAPIVKSGQGKGLLSALFSGVFGAKMAPFADVPGPPPRFPLGNMDILSRHQLPWELVQHTHRSWGGFCVLWAGPKPLLFVTDPALIEHVLVDCNDRLDKADLDKAFRVVISETSPFILHGEAWAAARRDGPLGFARFEHWLDRQGEVMATALARSADALGSGRVDLAKWAQRLTFDAFCAVTVGRPLGDRAFRDFMHLGVVGDRRIKAQGMYPASPLFRAAQRRWRGVFSEALQDAPEAALIHAAGGCPMAKQALATEVSNVFYGGGYSATAAVSNATSLLARHPEVVEQLRAELQTVDLKAPDSASLAALPMLDAVLRETLRLCPPAPVTSRNVSKHGPVTITGCEAPAGTTIFLSGYPAQVDPEVYPEPMRFQPSRWAYRDRSADFDEPHFMPFGRGPRRCLGQQMALLWVRLAIATIAARWRFSPENPASPQQVFFFGCMMPAADRGQLTAV